MDESEFIYQDVVDCRMVSKRWTHSNKSVYNVAYHLIWCPKYRRKVLVGDIANELENVFHTKAAEIDVVIESLEIMPDHVHLFVKASPTAAPHWIVQQLKGYSARTMRDRFPELKSKIPSLWTRSYYCESVGHISEDTIKKYIAEQKNK